MAADLGIALMLVGLANFPGYIAASNLRERRRSDRVVYFTVAVVGYGAIWIAISAWAVGACASVSTWLLPPAVGLCFTFLPLERVFGDRRDARRLRSSR